MENFINYNKIKYGEDKFHQVESKLNKFGLVVERIENSDRIPVNDELSIKAGVFSMALLKSGSGKLIINNNEYQIYDNTLTVILPHYYIKRETIHSRDVSGYIIIISIDFFINIQIKTEYIIPIFLRFYNSPVISLTEEETDLLCKYFDLLSIEENKTLKDSSVPICSGIMSSLIYRLSEISSRNFDEEIKNLKSKSSLRIFKDFLRLIINEYKNHRDVTYYANALCVTPKYLSTIVKELSNTKASKWIEILVITEAKNLLRYSDMTIQEIAYSLNFPNPSFFGAYFKKYAGITPGEYRKK